MKSKENLMLYTLAVVQFTNVMDFMIMMPLGPQLMRTFNLIAGEFGILVSSYTLSAGVSGFAAALFIDRFERKKLLFTLYAGFVIGTLLCAMADGFYPLAAARIFTGLFGGVLGALSLSIVGDTIPFERRGSAMGIVMSAFSIASVLGVPFGLFLAQWMNWHTPFYFLALMGVPVLFLIRRFVPTLTNHLRKADQAKESPFVILKYIRSNPNLIIALTLMSILMCGQFIIIPFISPYMVYNVGFKESDLQYIYLFGGLAGIFSNPFAGRLADKLGKKRVFYIFGIATLIPVFLITHLPQVVLFVALIVTTLFFIGVGGRSVPAMTIISGAAAPKYRGSFMSLNSALMQMAAGIASLLGSAIVVSKPDLSLLNYNITGYISIGFGIIAVLMMRKVSVVDQSPSNRSNNSVPKIEPQTIEPSEPKLVA